MIHPTALVHPQAMVPDSCTIGAFCVLESGVVLGERVRLDSHVVLKSGVQLGNDVVVHSQAVLGDVPQILGKKFPFESRVVVGDRTVIREGVTIHRASQPNATTRVGEDCFLMAFAHIGHDCTVGNHCILANQALLAGCVTLQDYVFLSGHAVVHQFVHVGESALFSGNTAVSMHVPPFVIAFQGNDVVGINLVGLRRRAFCEEAIGDIKRLYRMMYGDGHFSFKKKAAQALEAQQFTTERGRQFLQFFLDPKPDRGFIHPY